MNVKVRGQHLPHSLSTLPFETESLNLELSNLGRLASQQAPGAVLALLFQWWDYKCTSMSEFT